MTTPKGPIVDLRSDTVTRPTPAMREAMAKADVGDDVFGEDPTVNALQERVARTLGKEAALFVPSGTMGNLLCILAQTQRGETVILSEDSHPFNYEGANVAMFGGLLTRTVRGRWGMMTRADIEPHVRRTPDPHFSQTTLIAVENTSNRGGGNVYNLADLAEIRLLADENGMKVHCDGARLFNAVVHTGITAAEYVRHCDTVSFCFSKGLGAPVGSIIAGPRDTIARAVRYRKALGGGMRQAGVLAAAAIYALDHHVERLKDDHRRAAEFRKALEALPSVSFPMPTPTNIVLLDVPGAPAVVEKLRERGVLVFAIAPGRIRAVFHLDIDDNALDRAIDAFHSVLSRR